MTYVPKDMLTDVEWFDRLENFWFDHCPGCGQPWTKTEEALKTVQVPMSGSSFIDHLPGLKQKFVSCSYGHDWLITGEMQASQNHMNLTWNFRVKGLKLYKIDPPGHSISMHDGPGSAFDQSPGAGGLWGFTAPPENSWKLAKAALDPVESAKETISLYKHSQPGTAGMQKVIDSIEKMKHSSVEAAEAYDNLKQKLQKSINDYVEKHVEGQIGAEKLIDLIKPTYPEGTLTAADMVELKHEAEKHGLKGNFKSDPKWEQLVYKFLLDKKHEQSAKGGIEVVMGPPSYEPETDPYSYDFDSIQFKVKHEFGIANPNAASKIDGIS